MQRRSETPPDSPDNGSTVEITAKRVVQEQLETQKRRRTAANGRGSSSKTSVWSTVAAALDSVDGHFSFRCATCDFVGRMNKNQSTSNIIDHYKTHHSALYLEVVALNKKKATQATIANRINNYRRRCLAQRQNASVSRFFCQGRIRVSDVSLPSPGNNLYLAPPKTIQAVAAVMFACATEAPCSNIVSPMLQGLVDVFGGRMQFSSKQPTEKMLFQTYAAVCNILGSSVADEKAGCITVDGWSAALRAPILGITWHYVDENWKMSCIPIATLNMGTAARTGEQMRCIIEEILSENAVVGSDDIKVHTGTSNNEAATALAVDLLTNYVGSVRCVVHTLALCVNDVFENGTPWQKYLDHVNKITSYFNHHQKAAQLLMMKQLEEGVTRDRLKRLKHDVPTRWHSKLAAMSAYLCRLESISAVAQELSIPPADLPSLTSEQQDVLAEFITVLTEVRRVAIQLEADKKVTMSRAPRLLRELYETLLIMSGSMLPFGSGSTDA